MSKIVKDNVDSTSLYSGTRNLESLNTLASLGSYSVTARLTPVTLAVLLFLVGVRCKLSAAAWKTILPAQIASSCLTTKGCARNRFAWARIATVWCVRTVLMLCPTLCKFSYPLTPRYDQLFLDKLPSQSFGHWRTCSSELPVMGRSCMPKHLKMFDQFIAVVQRISRFIYLSTQSQQIWKFRESMIQSPFVVLCNPSTIWWQLIQIEDFESSLKSSGSHCPPC